MLDANNPDSGKIYTTIQAADYCRELLTPYNKPRDATVNSKNSFEELAEQYLKMFGDTSKND